MTTKRNVLFSLASGIMCILFAGVAEAGIPQAYVSTAGADAHPCSATQPCRTFNRALMVVDPGGEIVVQNSGDYSPEFTITQSVTIDSGGNDASVNSTLKSDLCTINAGASDRVVFKGIRFNGHGTGNAAISVKQAGSVYVEHCSISDFTGDGVQMQNGGNLFVTNTDIHTCHFGVVAETVNDRAIKLVAQDSRFAECYAGVIFETDNAATAAVAGGGAATGLMSNCTISLCEEGLGVASAGGPLDLTMTNCRVFANTVGISPAGPSRVRLGHCVITANATGILNPYPTMVGGTDPFTNLIYGNTVGNAIAITWVNPLQ